MNLDSLICHCQTSLKGVIDLINKNMKGIVFVTDHKKRFMGTISDGDIRRAMLTGLSIDIEVGELLDDSSVNRKRVLKHFEGDPIETIIRKKPVYAHVNTTVEELLKLINERIWIIPLVDDDKRIVDFYEHRIKTHWPIAKPHLAGNEINYVMNCLQSNWISSQGEYIGCFENNFSSYCGMKYAVAVSNGTSALHLALKVLNIGVGDEVILPDFTFTACINAVIYTGATPVLVDVCENDWCIDPEKIKEAITDKTKAIMPVHIYGQPCQMDEIQKIAKLHNLFMIEDCAQAHGAEFQNKKVGSFGDISCFSFFANKIITTGEGGVCLTHDYDLAEKMRVLRDHGMSKDRKYWNEEVGYNYRMTNLQAAIGVAQLEKIDEFIEKRKRIKTIYSYCLKDMEFLFPQISIDGRKSVTWLVSYILDNDVIQRESLIKGTKSLGVDIRPFFYPLSSMPIYKKYSRYENANSKKISSRGISLPTSYSLSENDCQIISEKIIQAAQGIK